MRGWWSSRWVAWTPTPYAALHHTHTATHAQQTANAREAHWPIPCVVCVSAQARIPPTGSQVPDWMQHSRVDVSIQDQIKDQIPSIGGVELSSESEEEDEGGAAAPQKRWKPPKAGVRHPSSPFSSPPLPSH